MNKKFKIGEQYEKHEFDLNKVETILANNLRYEVYQYIGKDKITIFRETWPNGQKNKEYKSP